MKRILLVIGLALAPFHMVSAGVIDAMKYADDTAFTTATGAESLTGPLPNSGNVGTSVILGDVTLNADNTIFIGAGWSSLMPGDNAIAISGPENLDISIITGAATSFGFYFHEPTTDNVQLDGCNAACVDSTFEITFTRGGALVDTVSFSALEVDPDGFLFFGVTLDEIFDAVHFHEIVGGIDNEFFGEMYATRAVSEPGTLALLALGLLGLLAANRRRMGPGRP